MKTHTAAVQYRATSKGDAMTVLKSAALAASLLLASQAAFADCSLPKMEGVWKCTGNAKACIPGQETARIMKGDGTTYNYFDGSMLEGAITVQGTPGHMTATVTWSNGSSMTGIVMNNACTIISWRPDKTDTWKSKY